MFIVKLGAATWTLLEATTPCLGDLVENAAAHLGQQRSSHDRVLAGLRAVGSAVVEVAERDDVANLPAAEAA